MSEAQNTPPTEGGTPPTPTEGGTPPSGLPSEQTPETSYDGFQVNDALKEKFKDGKLNGRFGSIDEVLEKLKEAEDFKANTIRDQKANEGQQQQQQQAQQSVNATVQELLPAFIENGLTLTPEMEAKLTEGITDPTKKELAVYKFRDEARAIADRANQAYTAVGGKENYDAMQTWAVENLSDEEKQVFTADVNGAPAASAIAVQWLNDKYQSAIKEGHVPTRIKGQPTNTGVRPYADRRELYKDKDYIESPAGKRDGAAQKMYRARLNMTPDAVVFGR